MASVEQQRKKLEKMMDALAKEQAKVMLAEAAERKRKARQEAAAKRKEHAALFRSADAHRKIVLGGLTIAANADEWDPAEIVGALLVVGEQLAQNPDRRKNLREKGIQHLEARAAARKGGQ